MDTFKKTNYHKTKTACYMGFITQAVTANFAPLLFLKFHSEYHIDLGNIALISTSSSHTTSGRSVLCQIRRLYRLPCVHCCIRTLCCAGFDRTGIFT